jgi:hypothetical protein
MQGIAVKKGVNYIDVAKCRGIAEFLGLKVEQQKGFIKVTHPDHEDRAVYLGAGEKSKVVGRVDLSGFTHPVAIPHRDGPTKRVLQELDFSQPEEATLKSLFKVLTDGLKKRLGTTIEVTKRGAKSSSPAEVEAAILAACTDEESKEAGEEEPSSEEPQPVAE